MGTYWLDAGELFYCSFRGPASSTLVGRDVGHDGGPSLAWVSVRQRPLAGRITPDAGGEHSFGDGRERENLGGGAGGFGDRREEYVDRRALVAHAGAGLDAVLRTMAESSISSCQSQGTPKVRSKWSAPGRSAPVRWNW